MKEPGISKRRQRARYLVGDLLTGNVAFFLFNLFRFYLFHANSQSEDVWGYVFSCKLIVEQATVPLMMCGVFWLSGYYNLPFGKSRLQELQTTVCSVGLNTAIIYMLFLINDGSVDRSINYELIAVLFGILFICCYIVRITITLTTSRYFRKHQWEFRVLIIGSSATGRRAAKRLLEGPSRVSYHIFGYVSIPGESDSRDGEDVYLLENIQELCDKFSIDHLIIAPQSMDDNKILNLLYHLYPLNISIRIAPDTFSILTSSIRLNDIYGEPFVEIASPAISEASKNIKRTFDVVVSALALTVFSPLYLVIAVMVKMSSPGKIIFSQERIGRKQRPFRIYKFRSMTEDAEKDGPQLSSDSDTRITKVGKTLRKYRLDELPQFWNVLIGDMSIVGPRPERRHYIEMIMRKAPYYALVCQVRPGITSWGMVKYGYASNVTQMVERTRYDLIYLSNMSLSLDLKILIYTVRTVVCGRGI